jgi:hypothetical protein
LVFAVFLPSTPCSETDALRQIKARKGDSLHPLKTSEPPWFGHSKQGESVMMERFLRAFRRSRDLSDVLAMEDSDLADLGITRAQALALNALPDDVPARVQSMGRVFGLSDETLLADSDRWHELLYSCNRCDGLPACRRFMAREEQGSPDEVHFCPNSGAFRALARMDVAAG